MKLTNEEIIMESESIDGDAGEDTAKVNTNILDNCIYAALRVLNEILEDSDVDPHDRVAAADVLLRAPHMIGAYPREGD